VIHLFIALASTEAGGLGPFYLPAIGASETIRTMPAFTAADEHNNKSLIVNITGRWVNLWAFNADTETPYDWKGDDDTFEFRYGSYLIDMEMYTLTGRLSYLLSENLSVELSVPVHYYGGGIMDGAIEHFHDSLSIGQHHRDDWPRNQTNFIYVKKDGTILNETSAVAGFLAGNPVIGSTITLKRYPCIAIRGLVKIPVAVDNAFIFENGFDFTLQGLLSWQKGKWYGYHGIGLTRFGKNSTREINFSTYRSSAMNSLEYSFSDRTSIIVHNTIASPDADYPQFENPIIETTFGFKCKLYKGVFEFGLIENLFFYDNSPDFGIHIGYSYTYP
jgi:hypothetical protein